VPTVLHVSPHPDDEVVAAPATLLALRRAGHRVVNLAASLGAPGQRGRRLAELTEACRRADVELVVHEPPLAISDDDDLELARRELAAAVAGIVEEIGAELVIAPSPHDRHHGHEVVGRAVVDALSRSGAPRLWLWGLWASLPQPTLLFRFGDELLAAAAHAVEAHAGELDRNDYAALVRARAVAGGVQGVEQVFGYGAAGRPGPYADALMEVVFTDGDWRLGAPRELDPAAPLAPVDAAHAIGWWLRAPTFRERLNAEGPRRVPGP
jgi:LmbE family N-acetylglucosaminyl deacetylase